MIGGCWPQQDGSGKAAPQVYQKSGEAKRVIATLEALGLLLALLGFGLVRKLEDTNMLIQALAFIDNWSNRHAVNRLITKPRGGE